MKTKIVILFLLLLIAQLGVAQTYTTIPDSKFEQALIDIGIDSGTIDGRVLTETIQNVKYLNILNKGIKNLSGIQDFINLEELNAAFNSISTIDLSKNTKLKSLDLSYNELVNLNLTSNTKLEKLYCSSNKLSAIDLSNNASLLELDCSTNKLAQLIVSSNSTLEKLFCANNSLDSMDLSTNTKLVSVNCANNRIASLKIGNFKFLKNFLCGNNQLQSVDVSQLDSLELLDISNNQISAIDVTQNLFLNNLNVSSNRINQLNTNSNDSLQSLDCSTNQLKSLDLSKNSDIKTLSASSNQFQSLNLASNHLLAKVDLSQNLLSSLDLSVDTSLMSLVCSTNLLTNLNIKNGKNSKIDKLDVTDNPDLRCILVDDVVNSNNKTDWKKDNSAQYALSCIDYTYVPDDNFENALAAYDDISNDNYVPTSNILTVQYLKIDSSNISNLTGIEKFVSLDSLNCSGNKISNLNTNFFPNLQKLNCSGNQLYSLVLKNDSLSKLAYMDARNNPLLTCIQVNDTAKAQAESNWFIDTTANYTNSCLANKTYIPDDSFEQALIDLGYDKGSLDDYVFTDSIKNITNLEISGKKIFDLTGIQDFKALDSLDCSKNFLDSLFLDSLKNLKKLVCYSNYLSQLNVSKNTQLQKLNFGDNLLKNIDIGQDTLLSELYCNDNQIESLDISKNVILEILNCNSNDIINSGLSIQNNPLLKKLYCANNKLSNLNFSYNKLLNTIDCSNNEISTLDLDSCSQLKKINASLNKIVSLNFSNDTLLEELNVNSNLLSNIILTDKPLLQNFYVDDNLLSFVDISKNDSLRQFSAAKNQISALDISKNQLLNTLNVNNNSIASLSLSNNDSITVLKCNGNNLTQLDIKNKQRLSQLFCEYNSLDSIIFLKNDSLEYIYASNNQLTKITLDSLRLLRQINLDKNQLTELNTNNNDSLRILSCADNDITTFNASNNTVLESLNCSFNSLNSLIIRNSNNSQLSDLNATSNPSLYCIEIDNASAINAHWKKDEQAKFTENCHYDETYIPDANFEAALSTIIGEASNNADNYIPTDSISKISVLDISSQNISDLTGIQDFKSLTNLNIQNNAIDSLDLSADTNLLILNCSHNNLDSVSFTANKYLQSLDVSYNKLQNLDVSYLDSLKTLNSDSNLLSQINLIANTKLTSLSLENNQLTELYLNNGNNDNLLICNLQNNPQLICAEVDNPSAANSGSGNYANWKKDASLVFSSNCHYNQSYIPDDAFEQALIDFGYDNTGMDDYVPTPKIQKISYLNIGNKGIRDLTGLQDFTSLVTLFCNLNLIKKADFSQNNQLITLNIASNLLDTLIISGDSVLKTLNASDNRLKKFDFTQNTELEELDVSKNLLTSVSIIANLNLTKFNASDNGLYSVDANNGFNNLLVSFDLRNNPDLRCILVDDISLAQSKSQWYKDATAGYKLICDDDDNDGIADSDDLCPNTPLGDFVDLFGCTIFRLPSDNFSLTAYSETCRDGNDGRLKISAQKVLDYTISLTGSEDTIMHNFTDNIEIKNLRADTFRVDIRVPKYPEYLQTYKIIITQPQELSVYSDVDTTKKQLNLKMTGSEIYFIQLNEQQLKTTRQEVHLKLQNGENKLVVYTDKDCQGTFMQKIMVSEHAIAYPNPFNNNLSLYLNREDVDKVNVKIYSTSGKLMYQAILKPQNGTIQLNTGFLKSGLYNVYIKSAKHTVNYKVFKQ